MTKVLVIDDHPIVLQGCKQVLEDAGVESVTQASSLVDGFRLYRTIKPDLIVVDLSVRSGALDGISFIRRLRVHDKTTPILVFSMHSDPVIVSPHAPGRRHGLPLEGHLVRRVHQGVPEGARGHPLYQP